MPSLADMLKTKSLPGFGAVENRPASPPPPMEEKSGLNPYLRCPLPPFSTTVDTIRQFNMTGKTPVIRVIPLPIQQGAGGGVTSNITNITTTASGATGGTSPTPEGPLTPSTAFLNVPFLLPGGTFTAVLKMAKSFQLIQLGATQPVEARLYSNAQTQIADIARISDASVIFDNIEGIITDVLFDTAPFRWNWENRIGANADNPQTINIYITVVNPSETTGVNASTVTVVFQSLET